MKIYKLYQIDSFTKNKFLGNPAGVITNADGLTDDDMQRIARELNNSETAFIFDSDSDDYDVHVRFFTPTKEVPICGHATIAAHYARAVENKLESCRVYQKTGAGILPVDIVKEGDDYSIIMTQGKIEFGSPITGKDREDLLGALGLIEEDLKADYPIQIASTGHPKVMIAINDVNKLHSIAIKSQELIEVGEKVGCHGGFYVFTSDFDDSAQPVHGRMFAPGIGIAEDPVTGNANGPLGAYLVHHGLVNNEGSYFTYNPIQGEAINRAGTMKVEVDIADCEPVKVKITGQAVIVYTAELTL